MEFYTEEKNREIYPLKVQKPLKYVLDTNLPISLEEITLKYAFPGKWKVSSRAIKDRIRNILVKILDVGNLQIERKDHKIIIFVPLKPLNNENIGLLPNIGNINIPIVVKLIHNTLRFTLKCSQILVLDTNIPEEENEESIKKEEKSEVKDKIIEEESKEIKEEEKKYYNSITSLIENFQKQEIFYKDIEENNKEEESEEEIEKKEEKYSGIIAIDFGTTNSVVVVRDPLYAAEEIKKDLSKEQWDILIEQIDNWINYHLATITPTLEDLFVEEIINDIPNLDLPPSGSLSIDILEDLKNISKEKKIELLKEVISTLSNYDFENNPHYIHANISQEIIERFENTIYPKTLESQRYFILELEKYAGPGPISSAIQIIAAPVTTDQYKLYTETEIDIGCRVHLLMRSAANREADIRQFAITVKRYFGQDSPLKIVPGESDAVTIDFMPDTLCQLIYKKLIERALEDINRRAEKGLFRFGNKIKTMVATFPTTYPASLRRRIRDILNDLDIEDIDTRFDEGTASVLYYIWREVCADPICGIHGIMARCRLDRHHRAYQNILLFDLGGGTTDIALIQLIYEELPIFEPIDKTESKGGRYFRITPRLLGTTGHRYIGGDLITLWLFRLVKTKIADRLLSLLNKKNIISPPNDKINNILNNLPEEFTYIDGTYKQESLLEWSFNPSQNLRKYEILNQTIIDPLIPTRYENNPLAIPNFFTIWDITEEAKKKLGCPITTFISTGLGNEWVEKVALDKEKIYNLIINIYPWLSQDLNEDDFIITLNQEEIYRMVKEPVKEAISLAINLALARLKTKDVRDKLDKFIFSGLSCNLKVVQEEARKLFKKYPKLFDFNLANVIFEPELAKTSVAMGACIGRYLEALRLDPSDEKTREMLRQGYDQVELVVENLFTNLACKLVYDSLVAMVQIFDYGQELDKKSFIDKKPVARTNMKDLRPVQEKFWIYRVDFEGASPQYLGLINAEAVAYKHDLDFRKFREEYLVGFEADAELFVRAFFLPKGPKNILALNFLEDTTYNYPAKDIIKINKEGNPVLTKPISCQEIFNRRVILEPNIPMIDTIQYSDGSKFRCIISEPLPFREIYDFYIENNSTFKEPKLLSHFHIKNEDEVDDICLACDEKGRIVLLLSTVYDIKIWGEIDYIPQKIDIQYDPFCGFH